MANRTLNQICHLGKTKTALIMKNHGQKGTEWKFQCPKAIIDEEHGARCETGRRDCPVYYELLRKADEMSDKEYQNYSNQNLF